MYDETVPNITDVCPKSVVMNEYFVYGFYPSEHDNSSTRRLTHYLHHTESAIEHDYRSTFDSLKYLGKYIVASTTLSGTAMFAALFASICGTLAGKPLHCSLILNFLLKYFKILREKIFAIERKQAESFDEGLWCHGICACYACMDTV